MATDGLRTLATLGPMLPLRVASELMRGIAESAADAGCTQVAIGDGLRIAGAIPPPGTSPTLTHRITIKTIKTGGTHPGMLDWACSCCESFSTSVFGELGRAVEDATEHIPPGQRWTITGVTPR